MKGKQATIRATLSSGLYEVFSIPTSQDCSAWTSSFTAWDGEAATPTDLVTGTPTIDNTEKTLTVQVLASAFAGLVADGENLRILRYRALVNPGDDEYQFFYGDLEITRGGP